MKEENEKLEKTIEKSLELLEEGKSVSEILSLFPEFEAELKEIFQIIKIISENKIIPKRELLEKIISKIETENNVTKEEYYRYINKEEIFKGRSSLKNFIKNWFNMTKEWKIIVPVGTLLIVAVLIFFSQLSKQKPEISLSTQSKENVVSQEEQQSNVAQETLPRATGNVDDIVSALLSDASSEASQLEEDIKANVELLSLDSENLNNFLGVYNENDF
jgi:hypothetical protein